jgi:hypothetical protein
MLHRKSVKNARRICESVVANISCFCDFEYRKPEPGFSHELGSRILDMYSPVQGPDDPLVPEIATLLRRPLPAQALTIFVVLVELSPYQDLMRKVVPCGPSH